MVEDDLATFFDQQRDPEANQMAAFPARERIAFMAQWTMILADETIAKQTILCDQEVASNIVSWEVAGAREVSYWLGRNYWGKGVATRALSAFLEQMEARPLYAHVAKHNTASMRVLHVSALKGGKYA